MQPIEEEHYERSESARPPTAGTPGAPPPSGPGDPTYYPPTAYGQSYYQRSSGTVVRGYNYRAERAIWLVVAIVDTLIAIRFFMRLLGASMDAEFVRMIYGITAPLVAPFRGIFPQAGQGAYILEPESLIAIVIYLLIGWALVALIRILTAPRSRSLPY